MMGFGWVTDILLTILYSTLAIIGSIIFLFLFEVQLFWLKERNIRRGILNNVFFPKIFEFIKWKLVDIYHNFKYGKGFNEFGMTLYANRQGSGKTSAMVYYLDKVRKQYPKALILTNFAYKYETRPLNSWRDLLEVKNNRDGVVFAIDEIHTEFSSKDWEDFPDNLLQIISYQRKQRKKIIASSQVFARVVKQLREQAVEVAECKTIAGRWTFVKVYDKDDYEMRLASMSTDNKKKIHKKFGFNFVQSDEFRKEFDTYKEVERLKNKKFIPQKDRKTFEPNTV